MVEDAAAIEQTLAAKSDRAAVLRAEVAARAAIRYHRYFPDCGPACDPTSTKVDDHAWPLKPRGYPCRVLYVPHMRLIEAGAAYRERLFLKANRVGGTETASLELVAHLTGLYPHWWKGRRFTKPVSTWCAGETMLTTRDILQTSLLGPIEGLDQGFYTGMIPYWLIPSPPGRKAGGVPRCIDQVWVTHHNAAGEPDGTSVVEFRSYDQGATSFVGTERDLIVLDEEPPLDVYTECLLRTMTTEGLVLSVFTPLAGMTPFIQAFMESSVTFDTEGHTVSARSLIAEE